MAHCSFVALEKYKTHTRLEKEGVYVSANLTVTRIQWTPEIESDVEPSSRKQHRT